MSEINTLFKNTEEKRSQDEESTDSIEINNTDDLLREFNAMDLGNEFPMDITVYDFENIEEFAVYLTKRQQKDKIYGCFSQNITMCCFFETKNNENILADIMIKNKEQNMGNFQIPNTNIKLINFSICPKCSRIFSFKELLEYYINPTPDSSFKDRAEQYREDTRVYCHDCKTYFLPALVISDGTPKNEVQFLCRVQTTNAIEVFYRDKRKNVLSAKKENFIHRKSGGKTFKAISNDVSLKELSAKPTLISNLIQYTPANLVLNLIDGSNYQKGDVLFGTWQ
jgi:hypothetical protein